MIHGMFDGGWASRLPVNVVVDVVTIGHVPREVWHVKFGVVGRATDWVVDQGRTDTTFAGSGRGDGGEHTFQESGTENENAPHFPRRVKHHLTADTCLPRNRDDL